MISVTDGSGTVLGFNKYDEYGVPQTTNLGKLGYTAQAWVPEVGLWYYKARFYRPDIGRFMQTDPIGYADSPNLYAYVGNDSVNAYDPDGKKSYLVIRNIGGYLRGYGHTFLVDRALYYGDPNAQIFSWGRETSGDWKLRYHEPETYGLDQSAWVNRTADQVFQLGLPDGYVTSRAVALEDGQRYIPKGLNSNSAAWTVARAALGDYLNVNVQGLSFSNYRSNLDVAGRFNQVDFWYNETGSRIRTNVNITVVYHGNDLVCYKVNGKLVCIKPPKTS